MREAAYLLNHMLSHRTHFRMCQNTHVPMQPR